MSHRNNVCPVKPMAKDKFQARLAAAWSRVWGNVGSQVEMARAMGLTDTKTIERGLSGANLPSAVAIFNGLCADPTALDEILAHYGMRAVPTTLQAANDLSTAAGTIDAMAALIRSQDDNHRDHNETLAIAALLRPHLASLNAIVNEADSLRGAA